MMQKSFNTEGTYAVLQPLGCDFTIMVTPTSELRRRVLSLSRRAAEGYYEIAKRDTVLYRYLYENIPTANADSEPTYGSYLSKVMAQNLLRNYSKILEAVVEELSDGDKPDYKGWFMLYILTFKVNLRQLMQV